MPKGAFNPHASPAALLNLFATPAQRPSRL
jgi:hypothetical protein